MMPEFGDTVRVHTKEKIIEGVLMPRPEILEPGYSVIKLGSGYNIGIEDKKIIKIELVEKREKKRNETRHKLIESEKLPTVSILSFGGTISSKVEYKTGGVSADYTAEEVTAQDFISMLPELADIANLRAEKVMSVMSEDMTPDDWHAMAKRIMTDLNDRDIDGIVVTQGTDTLHYSTAAMSFFLKHINKPVVFTAAQRSIDRGSSDAFTNLLCAVNAAAKFDGGAVVTCMHSSSNDDYCILVRGTKVRKMHTSRRDAFRPINELPLAKVFENGKIEVLNNNYSKRNDGKAVIDDKFEHKTALIYAYPGMDPNIFDYYIGEKYKGIVIAGTGLGHVATNAKLSLVKKLKEMADNNITVVIAPQTIYGRVDGYVYTNARKLSMTLNCIYAEDMTPETAFIKLGWVLGHSHKIDEVKKSMLTNYAGEITERTDARAFLN